MYLAGLGVNKLGNSSVQYQLALFPQQRDGEDLLLNLVNGHAATDSVIQQFGAKGLVQGESVHVFVDPDTRKPTPIPGSWRDRLQELSLKC